MFILKNCLQVLCVYLNNLKLVYLVYYTLICRFVSQEIHICLLLSKLCLMFQFLLAERRIHLDLFFLPALSSCKYGFGMRQSSRMQSSVSLILCGADRGSNLLQYPTLRADTAITSPPLCTLHWKGEIMAGFGR